MRCALQALYLLTARIVVAALVLTGCSDPPPLPSYGDGVRLTTAPGLELDPSLSDDGTALAYASDESGAFEIYVRDLDPQGGKRQITADGSQSIEPAFSPDGEWIAYHSLGRGGVWLVPAAGGAPRRLTATGSRPVFSPDGEWIAYQTQSNPQLSETSIAALGTSILRLVRADASAGRRLTRLGTPSGAHGAPAFSPDGRWVAFSVSQRSSSEIWAVRVDDGELLRLYSSAEMAYDPSYGAAGRYLYFSLSRREVHELLALPLDPDGRPDGDAVSVAGSEASSARHVSLSGDGDLLAYTAISTRSNLYSLPLSGVEASGKPRPLTTGDGRNTRAAFSADGKRISYDHQTAGGRVGIWVMNADGSAPFRVSPKGAPATLSSWLPDGRVAYHLREEGEIRAVDPASPGEGSRLAALGDDVGWPRLSPDGALLAYHARGVETSLQVHLLELTSGDRRQLTHGEAMTAFPNWSPDGRRLIAQAEVGAGRHVLVLPVDGRETPELLTSGQDQHWSFSFSPDGGKVAFAADRDGYWNVWWVSRATGEERQLTYHQLLDGYVRYPAWSPANDQIVYELAETTGDILIARRVPAEGANEGRLSTAVEP